MPGILGLITAKPRECAEADVRRMAEAVRHDQSYKTGFLTDESLGVYVAWVTRTGSASDGVHIRSEKGEISAVFSGEDFSGRGTETTGLSYLVNDYEQDGAFPAGLNGRFHGLIVDSRRKRAVLFNDRFGMHRIYYHEATDAVYFAAEAKAILAVRPELRGVAPRSLGEFVSCGCVLENRTLFRGVSILPPASVWSFRGGEPERKKVYFSPSEWEGQSSLEPEDYYRKLRNVFAGLLPRYFAGGEAIGLSLTGGLDTRMIMAWHKPSAGSLRCYSFGSMFRDTQDVVLAGKIARACRQPYDVINVGEEFLSQFARYAERTVYLTDGTVDVSHSPDLFVNERAAAIAPIRMTGNYGSEVMRGTVAFKPVPPPAGLFASDLQTHVDAAAGTYSQLRQGHPLSFAIFRQAPWHHYGLLALEQTQVTVRTPFLDNDLVRLVYRAPKARGEDAVSLRLIAESNPKLARIRTDRGLGGAQKAPLAWATREFLKFTAKAEYAYDYGMPQWLARADRLLSPLHVERVFLGRHKFYHFRVWYRDVLKSYVRDMLLDPRTLSRPYLRRNALEAIVTSHLAGERNYTLGIHKVLTLELFHRLFVDRT